MFKGFVAHIEANKNKCNKQKLKGPREHPHVLTTTVHETLGRQAFDTTVKRPVNERDDLVVIFEP